MAVKTLKNNDSYKCYVPHSNNGVDLIIYEAGYEKCDPLHIWGPHKKFGYVVHYVINGKGILKVNNEEFLIEKNTLFFINPDDNCYYEADEKEPWEYVWVYFGGMHAKNIINQTIFSDGVKTLIYDKDDKLEKMLRNIYQEKKHNYSYIQALANLYTLLAWFMKKYKSSKPETHSSSAEKYWQQILNYIISNVSGNLSIQSISKSVGLDRTYIYKMFKKNVGISPIEYIEALKIYLSCELIKQNKMSLNNIAFELGFNDYSWFNKLFKRITGVNPVDYSTEWVNVQAIPVFEIVQNRAKDYYNFFNKSNQ